jgi:hypothetical protein
MTKGTDRTTETNGESRAEGTSDTDGCVKAVGTYETGDDVVFYDTENPLAWVQARDAVRLEEMA